MFGDLWCIGSFGSLLPITLVLEFLFRTDVGGDGTGLEFIVEGLRDFHVGKHLAVGEKLALIAGHEGPGNALTAGSGSPSDAMDVDLRIFRNVVVDDMADVIDVQTS